MHSRVIQCKQAAYTASKSGKGSQRNMYACMKDIPRFSRSAWAENIANAWLPYTNIWETSKAHNFNSKTWVKIPQGQISSFVPLILRAHVKIISPRRPHTKQKKIVQKLPHS